MSQYIYRCSQCLKKIKRNPGVNESVVLCQKCKKENRIKEKEHKCLTCEKTYIPRLGKSKNSVQNFYCSKKCAPKDFFKGRKFSLAHRENLSKAAGNGSGCYAKYYKIDCPYIGKIISVQGTYEFKYAQYLNQHNVNWIRGKNVNLRYKLNENDIVRTYYPDFYLIDSNEYIETKGYFSEKDQNKMAAVKQCQPNAKITLLFFEDLKNLGIF